MTHNFNALDLLTLPVWIVFPLTGEMLFANRAAAAFMPENDFNQLRQGAYSVHAHRQLADYITDLRSRRDIIEILTVSRDNTPGTLSCRLSLRQLPDDREVILFEGIDISTVQGLKASRSLAYQRKKQGFYARFF